MNLKINEIYAILNESAADLKAAGIVADIGLINPETVLIGTGSVLDSLGFVTLITDFESRLVEKVGNFEFSFSLMDLSDFDETNPLMTAKKICDYAIQKL